MKIIATIALFYVALCILLYFVQRSLIYFPSQDTGASPMQVVSLQTEDGLTLTSWYYPSTKPTIAYFQGNAGNIADRVLLVAPYIKQGYGVLLVGFRGYGGNPGKPSEEGFYKDARAAMQFLQGSRTILFGESIGSAVAIQMATEYPVEALILQAPFSSITDVAAYHYPFFPVRLILKDRFECVQKAKKITCPVLIIHGENDNIVPPAFSLPLYDAFGGQKERILIPNRGHNDLYEAATILHWLSRTNTHV